MASSPERCLSLPHVGAVASTCRRTVKGTALVVGPDTRVHDPMAMAEIEMYGELVIAASSSDGPLPPEQIDAILGVDRPGR